MRREEGVRAVRREDLVYATLDKFRRRVDEALEVIHAARNIGRVGVSFSGGKDSTVTLDLVRRVIPDAPAAFFDSGCELASTYAIAQATPNVEIVSPRMSMLDMARYAGWWEYASPVDAGCPFDAKRVLIEEPSEAFVVRAGLRAIAHGVRAEESSARRRHASRGALYLGSDRTYYLQPVIHWGLSDVWAYIASRELEYNSAYDRMERAGVPRESQRVATLLGERGSGWGRHAHLRSAEPDRWRRLVADFPGLSRLA